ncbi:MAG: glycerol-3-phosphate 1-O-acyltransferase PlsY [Oscillospiraceae bacterium]|jgi:glycerol-3-phosphate acyltransferase PlsY|nr:glycerol-3-phosphate 1-O-acyltransferase PlsY [Oscillospiraceae bacterium]
MPNLTIAAYSLIVVVLSYLLGSISFSIIFTKRLHNNIDIRTLGSGNAGLTNVLRSVGVKAGILTLIFDFAKGAVSVYAGRMIFQYFCTFSGMPPYFAQYGAYLAGLFCMIGHIYPVYFNFRGGKGVLSSAAMLLVLDWRLFAVAIGIFILTFALSQIVSLGSILASASFPIANFLFLYFQDYRAMQAVPQSYVWITTLFACMISSLLIWKHRQNIKRLKSGTEKKLKIHR